MSRLTRAWITFLEESSTAISKRPSDLFPTQYWYAQLLPQQYTKLLAYNSKTHFLAITEKSSANVTSKSRIREKGPLGGNGRFGRDRESS